MPVKIVDASALAALLFGEPEGAAVAKRLQDGELVAPALLAFEIANICLKKMARHSDRRDALLEAFTIYRRMAIETVEIDHGDAIRLAEQSGLTAYDASYLWLAQQHGGELVTLDKRLNRAAQALRQ